MPELPELPEAVEWWDKVSAWGTLGAVIVALFVAINEGRRRRLDKEDSDAGQARLITAHKHAHGYVISNHSLAPILALKIVKVEVIEDGLVAWELGTGEEGEDGAILEVMAPGATKYSELREFRRPGSSEVVVARRLASDDTLRCTFAFTDAQGLRWKRVDQKQPERVLDRQTGWRRVTFWR